MHVSLGHLRRNCSQAMKDIMRNRQELNGSDKNLEAPLGDRVFKLSRGSGNACQWIDEGNAQVPIRSGWTE